MNDLTAPFRQLPHFRMLSDDKFLAACPAHNDSSPSLKGTIRNNRLLLRCWAGCAVRDVLRAMGLTWGALFRDNYRKLTATERRTQQAMAAFEEWRNREIGRLAVRLRGYDATFRLGPWESLSGADRGRLGAAARDYSYTEWTFEVLRTGTRDEALAIYREAAAQ